MRLASSQNTPGTISKMITNSYPVDILFVARSFHGDLVETLEPYSQEYTNLPILPVTLRSVSGDIWNVNAKYERSFFILEEHPDLSYSHSIVAGGLEVISYTTRFTLSTSFTMRVEIFSRTSHGMRAQSAVMPSMEVTARIPTV